MVEYIKPAAIIGIPSLVVGALYASYRTVVDLPSVVFPQQDPIYKIRNAYELFRVCSSPFPEVVLPEFCTYTSPSFIAFNVVEATLATAIVGILLYKLVNNWKNSKQIKTTQS